MPDLVATILASTVLASTISNIITVWNSQKLKDQDYKNEYFKIVLQKRLETYEFIERQISVLKSIEADTINNEIYYSIFAYGKEKFDEFQQNLLIALSQSQWISKKTIKEMEKLNQLFFTIETKSQDNEQLKQEGIINHKTICYIRNSLEKQVNKDYLELHKIDKFLKSKKEK